MASFCFSSNSEVVSSLTAGCHIPRIADSVIQEFFSISVPTPILVQVIVLSFLKINTSTYLLLKNSNKKS